MKSLEKLTCRAVNGLDRPFSRTAEDDLAAQVPPVLTSLTPQQAISDKELEMVLNLCHQKCDELLIENEVPLRHRFGHLEQSIKALVAKLAQVETSELSNAIISVQTALTEPHKLPEATEKIKDAIYDLILLHQNTVDLSGNDQSFHLIPNDSNRFRSWRKTHRAFQSKKFPSRSP